MTDILKSENLKYRRTFTRRILLLSPLFFIIIAIVQTIYAPVGFVRPWNLLLGLIYNWWPVIFIPLGIALFAALVALQEKKAGNYRNVRVHNISPVFIWISKVVLMAYHTFLATLVLIAVTITTGLITAGGEIPWGKILAGGFTVWISSLAVIPLQLWAASWKGTFFSMAMGVTGFFAGVLAAPENYWVYVPWSWPTNASGKVKNKDLDFTIDYRADNELGRLCEAFNEMKNELKESLISQWMAEQERQEMVHALAHDLKTPLAVIQGYVEALLEGNIVDAQKTEKYLQVIKDNANKASLLTKEMLYAAELEMTGTELNIAPVDINAFLMQKKEGYEIMAISKNINIKVDVAYEGQKDIPCFIDAVKLERVLDNIVSNSIRYVPEYGTIAISAVITCNHVNFTICDTGKGFSNKDLSNLFNKFYRGDESRSFKEGHAGLGLYIAKRLVEMHGGSITAFNAESGGACIEFDIKFLQ